MIHPGAQPRPVTEGIPFLGFVVYPEHRRLKRRKGIHYRRRFERLVGDYAAGYLASKIKPRMFMTTHMPFDPYVNEESVAEIRKRTGLKEGGEDYLFFTTDHKNISIVLQCTKASGIGS